jgi:chromosomal replication initiation ATPase DnaA
MTALPDLRSRLVAMPGIAMLAPDDALIGAVLLKLFADRQLSVSEDVIVFLLHHMERSFAAARRLVAALDRAALVAQRRITVPLARQVLAAEDRPGGEGVAAG